ncbi:MAG: hypothetical protein Q8T03_08230 [Bacteroidota bacterium]|nr:hypothetical protein [Bacteroidota bacterium]
MKHFERKQINLFFILLFCSSISFSQDNNNSDLDEDLPIRKSKFQTGFYIGSYFANKYSASTYNGYGFDVEGTRNSFFNSLMYQKIVNEYGYGRGQYDYIADELGVDQGQWDFTESDMPVNMHYVPAIMVGFNIKVPVDETSAFIFNLNGSKLNIDGNFTITTRKPPLSNPANNNNIQNFGIRGVEQRLLFQMGFQKQFGEDEKLNFFGEVGLVGTLTKFDKNTIYINRLQIDLTYYLNQTTFAAPGPTRRPVGFGVGAFAGLGANVNINPKFTLQLLYSPSFEKVNIGTGPKLKLQNAIGLRVYYNFLSKKTNTSETPPLLTQ